MLKWEKARGVAMVKLAGELDHNSAASIRQELDEIISDERVKRLVLDLNELTFMDSSGIGVIIGRYRQMQRRGGSVCVRSGNRAVDRLLEISGLYRIVEKMQEKGGSI